MVLSGRAVDRDRRVLCRDLPGRLLLLQPCEPSDRASPSCNAKARRVVDVRSPYRSLRSRKAKVRHGCTTNAHYQFTGRRRMGWAESLFVLLEFRRKAPIT